MAKSVRLSIETKGDQFAPGTVGGDWMIVSGREGHPDYNVNHKYVGPDTSVVFDYDKDGAYWAQATRLDSAGEPLGEVVITTFILEPDYIVIQVAGSLVAEILPTAPEAVNPIA